jgi:quercetin dioxygenase-like cupin family protein
MPAKKPDKTVSLGQKIKQARLKKNLTLEVLANQTGFSLDYLKELEAGKAIPPVGTLLQIGRALDIDSAQFWKEQKNQLSKRVKAYTKRTENYAYTTLTPGAENKHLKAFKVAIDPLTEHKGVEYQHEGEEFDYVLEGKVEITVGDHINRLSEGDCLHFNSGIRHKLRNIGDAPAVLLVTIYQP